MTGIFDQITQSTAAFKADAPDANAQNAAPTTPPTETPNAPARTPQRLRDACQELLKFGHLEEHQKPNVYRLISTHTADIKKMLEPLDLDVGLDDIRGLAFVKVLRATPAAQHNTLDTHNSADANNEEPDDWSHPLVRKLRLNLEQTLLIAILRQHFIAYEQDSGTGANAAFVSLDELIPQLQIYLGDTGSETKERTRVINLLEQLKGHGLVSSADAHDRVAIRPIIAHLANPENLHTLVTWLRQQTTASTPNNNSSNNSPSNNNPSNNSRPNSTSNKAPSL